MVRGIDIGIDRRAAPCSSTSIKALLAYMTAALESVCKKIPPEKDSAELRKKIADELVACANAYRRSFADFERPACGR